MKKILLFLLLIFAYYQNYSNANEIENIPIIKKLDKKYLSLIDKDGRITNLKEFNKNGVVVVFEKMNSEINKPMYLMINSKTDKRNGLRYLNAIYTKSIEQYFLNKQAEINLDLQKNRYKVPIMYFNLDIDNFLFTGTNSSEDDLDINSKISALYHNYDTSMKERSKITTGYLLCVVKTNNNLNQTMRPTLKAGCQLAFYDQQKEKQIKTLLNIA